MAKAKVTEKKFCGKDEQSCDLQLMGKLKGADGCQWDMLLYKCIKCGRKVVKI